MSSFEFKPVSVWDGNSTDLKKNIRERDIDFADAPEMFESPMLVRLDERQDYGEHRYIGLGHIQQRLTVVVYTERAPTLFGLSH